MRLLCGTAVLAFIVGSTILAWRFGWERGSTEFDRWLYASVGAAGDIVKALMPLLAAWSFRDRQWGRGLACVAVFLMCSAWSFASSFGLTATQLANKLADQVVASQTYNDRKAEHDRLVQQLGWLPKVMPAGENAEAAARAAVEQVDASANAECIRR